MKTSRILKRALPGIALIIAAVVLSLLGYDAGFLAIAGAVAISVVIFRRWRTGDQLEKDERTSKLGAYSLSRSYLVSLIFALVLFIAVYLEMVNLNAVAVLQILIYVMTGSAIVFMLMMNRRGDVELP